MKKIVAVVALAMLSACSTITKVEGEQVVNQRLAVQVTDAWNKVALVQQQPYETWTQEGIPLDHLRFWGGIRAGQPLLTPPRQPVAVNTSSSQGTPGAPAPSDTKAPRVPTFAAGMPADQLVRLFETLYANDGSLVTMGKVEPAVFAGENGVRFEFALVRKSDDVQLRGVGWASVRNDELFAATFVAPRLAFFPRLLPKAESIIRTARIKS